MRLKHQYARQAAHPVNVSEALGRRLDLACHRSALQSSFVCHSPTRPVSHARPVGRAHAHGSALRLVARLRRPHLCCHADGLHIFLSGDASVRRARRARRLRCTPRRWQRLCAGRRGAPCLPDLRPGNKYFLVHACRRDRRSCIHPACARGLGQTPTARLVARLRNHSGNLGGREILASALVVALSRWAPRIRFHGAALRQRRDRIVPPPAPREWDRLFHRLGPPLELFCARQLHRLRLHRHSPRPGHPLHRICPALPKATSPAGGPLPFFLVFPTSPTWAFPTGATCFSLPSPASSMAGHGVRRARSSLRPWSTPPWTSCGIFCSELRNPGGRPSMLRSLASRQGRGQLEAWLTAREQLSTPAVVAEPSSSGFLPLTP